MIDLGEDAEDMILKLERLNYFKNVKCATKKGIRYVHIMKHSEYKNQLRVRCIYSEKWKMIMSHSVSEKKFKNTHKRKMNFLERKWECEQMII